MSIDRPASPVAQELNRDDSPTYVSERGEAYLDIVWRQFKKNSSAYVALWLMAPVFLIAIFAPAIASDQPYVYVDGDQVLYPWLRSIFNPEVPVDFLFNMAMLAFAPWLLLTVVANFYFKRSHVPGRRRVFMSLAAFVILTLSLCATFLFPPLGLRPTNKYRAREFVREELQALKAAKETGVSEPTRIGWYAPVPFGPLEVDLPARNQPPGYRKPSSERADVNDDMIHWLGTDTTGRDVLTRMLYGTRLAISVGFVAVSIYISIGIVVGALAGYFGGWTDIVISRTIEVVLLFPAFFLILTLVAMLGQSIFIVMFVIGLTGWPTIARLIRGEVLKQRAIDYTAAARSLGASHARIIFRHILPNAISPALVSAPFGVASAIVTEAGLSLLGFGVRPPAPSWGSILQLAHGNYQYWWLIVVPSVAMFFTVTVFNLVGSGLRDAMDPKLRV